MSGIARELDEKLKTLDAQSAALLEKTVREAIEQAVTNQNPPTGWPPGFFEKTAGAFADIPFERPPQGEFEKREDW